MPTSPTRTTGRYHSPLRARQAAETRRSIIDAALALFGENGWTATTLPAIAAQAGVSVDTIHSVFGTKSALLMVVIEVALVGDDEAAPMAERDDFALIGKGRRDERIRAGVRYSMAVYERSIPILRALQEAAASDDVARARLEQYDTDRHQLIGTGMTLILGREVPPEVTDSMYALMSPEVYTYLIHDRGWSEAAAEDWYVDLVKAAISRS